MIYFHAIKTTRKENIAYLRCYTLDGSALNNKGGNGEYDDCIKSINAFLDSFVWSQTSQR